MENRLASLRRLLRIYGNWLTVKLIGKDLVSKEDLAELKKYGKLPLGDEVDLIGRAFSLGRAASLSKKSEYKELTLEKLSKIKKFQHTSEDSLAIREAKLHAARHLQAAVDSAADGAFLRLNEATQDMLSDAVVKEIIKDEVALALKEKKTRNQLASSLSNKLDKTLTRDVKKIAVTEMHRAKQRGAAMAIANKVDIYSKSDGPSSNVSVVPNAGACDDCKSLYLTKDGNPKVFVLADLVSRGSNADAGISHKVGPNGLRGGWKAVMPPAHPNCYCELVYLPPGMKWQDGRLTIADELRYKNSLSKAVDKGSMSPTIKPPGPKSTQGPKVANPGSIQGLPAPGNEPGPGAPKSLAPTIPAPAPTASAAETAPAPQGGGASDASPSGMPWEYWGSRAGTPNPADGWEQSPSGAWRIDPALLGGAGAGSEGGEQQEAALDPTFLTARDWKAEEHSPSVLRDHLTEGKVILSEDLKTRNRNGGDATPGINTSYEEVISGNGSMLTKPGSETAGSDVNREVAGYELMTMFGSDRCPMTVSRNRNGVHSSCMHWLNTHTNAMKAVDNLNLGEAEDSFDVPGKQYRAMMEASKDPDKLRGQLEEIAVFDMVMNNRDRHVDNFMVNEDFTDVRAIDHGYCFTSGLMSYQGHIHAGFNSNNMQVKLSPELQERFETTSFGDMQRGFGKNLAEWQTAQTYLRMQYVLKVAEENEGKLPYDEFNEDTNKQDPNLRETPNEKFEDFAMDFIDKHSADPTSTQYATAKRFEELGVFATFDHSAAAEVGMTVNPLGRYRQEKIARQHRAEADAARGGDSEYRKRMEEEALQKRLEEAQTKLDASYVEMDKAEALSNETKDAVDDYYYEQVKTRPEKEVVDSDEYQKILKVHHKAYQAAGRARKNVDQLTREIEGVGAQNYLDFVPEGQDDTFSRLNDRIAAAESGKLPKKSAKPVSGIERTVVRMAADIEREKRGKPRDSDLEGLGFGNRKKVRP